MMQQRLAAKLPMALYTINIKSGEVKEFYHSTDWLNHVQFSPTDPQLMMYCHEGPWHEIDRIWTIRIDGSNRRLMHKRTMDMEIAGHEFFGPGNMIWYDLQTPKSQVFWLAGVNVVTDKRIRYKVPREEWSRPTASFLPETVAVQTVLPLPGTGSGFTSSSPKAID
jgi:oligogalacturonide lyase